MERSAILVCTFLLAFATASFAQLNIKVGYLGSYSKFEGINDYMQGLNASSPNEVTQPFPKIHILNGLDLGLRYTIADVMSVEGGWDFLQSNILTQQTSSGGGSSLVDKMKLQNSSLYLGLINEIDWFGYGVSLHRNTLSLANDIPNSKKYKDIGKDNYWSAKFFISLEYHSGFTGFAIRPYYNYPLGKYRFVDLNISESLRNFGLSVVIYNGK